MQTRSPLVFLFALTLALSAAALGQGPELSHYSEGTRQAIQALWDPARDASQKPDEVIQKLELRPGAAVADLGCGAGYFTFRLARAVGPTGRVYAVDINPEVLDYVKERAKSEHLQNIEYIVAEPHDPKLAPASVDMIFMCNTLHWIKERPTYYPLLVRALKPRGRLVDIDWKRITKSDIVRETEAAGFRVVRSYDLLADQYFLVLEH